MRCQGRPQLAEVGVYGWLLGWRLGGGLNVWASGLLVLSGFLREWVRAGIWAEFRTNFLADGVQGLRAGRRGRLWLSWLREFRFARC